MGEKGICTRGLTGPKGEPGVNNLSELRHTPGATVGPKGHEGQKGEKGYQGTPGLEGMLKIIHWIQVLSK